MHLRRVFAFIIASLMIAVLLPVAVLAEETVTIEHSVSPSRLTGAGSVTLTVIVKVADNSADGIENARIERDGNLLSDMVDVRPFEPKTITCPLAVEEDDLGKKIDLDLMWEGGSKRFSVKVNRENVAEPEVKFSRSFDKSSAVKGDIITISYVIENVGTVGISDIVVSDKEAGDITLTHKSLAAGKTRTLSYEHTMDSDLTSSPVLRYVANGVTYREELSAKKVGLLTVELDVDLKASSPEVASGDQITLECTVKNTGSLDLKNIRVSDDILGSDLYTASSLKADARKSFSKDVTLTQTTKFRFTVTAEDAAGNEYTFRSNSETVKVAELETAPPLADYDLTILVSSDTQQLSAPGDVNFTISVFNNSEASIANVEVVDQNDEVIKQFNVLSVGENTFNHTVSISQTSDFNFYALVIGEDGEYRVASGPVEIVVATPVETPTQLPEESEGPVPTAQADSGSGLGTLMIALVIVGLLIIITVIVLVVMVIKERKLRGQRPARRR